MTLHIPHLEYRHRAYALINLNDMCSYIQTYGQMNTVDYSEGIKQYNDIKNKVRKGWSVGEDIEKLYNRLDEYYTKLCSTNTTVSMNGLINIITLYAETYQIVVNTVSPINEVFPILKNIPPLPDWSMFD